MTTPHLHDSHSGSISRREALAAAGGAMFAVATGRTFAWGAEPAPAASPYGTFQVGLQSYSLRGFKTPEALRHTKTLGLTIWEAYPGHIPMNGVPKQIAEQKAMLSDAGVRVRAYGVLNFDENESKSRQAFDYAKAMGIEVLSANPQKTNKTFDLLDRLVEEYGIAIAIHNHGPKALYDKISDVEKMVKDRHPKVGACVDTGHYLRSDENPVDAIRRLGKRVFGVHLKDVKTIKSGGANRKLFTILGQGDLDIAGCLRELKSLKYSQSVAIEYEENPQNPLSDLAVCLKAIQAAVKQVG